jgi:hypothetical protein
MGIIGVIMVLVTQQIDGNFRTINSNQAFVTPKTVAFTGAAGLGAIGTVDLFTVVGDVMLQLIAVCSEDLAGASATLEAGVASNTAELHGQETATNIDNGDVVTSDAGINVGAGLSLNSYFVGGGADIIATVGTANITDGTLKYYAIWRPLSSDGSVVAA